MILTAFGRKPATVGAISSAPTSTKLSSCAGSIKRQSTSFGLYRRAPPLSGASRCNPASTQGRAMPGEKHMTKIEEQFGPDYDIDGPSIRKFRRMSKKGLGTLSPDDRRAYGQAVEDAVL